MELAIFFLKTWSIIYTFIIIGMIWALITVKPKDFNLLFNINMCFKWTLYITSIYSWFYNLQFMGMYNEVFKKCPHCDGRGYMQIYQIVGGFGEFNLDNPDSIARELDIEQIQALKEAVEDTKWFLCEECGESFSINKKVNLDDKIDIINSIGK